MWNPSYGLSEVDYKGTSSREAPQKSAWMVFVIEIKFSRTKASGVDINQTNGIAYLRFSLSGGVFGAS